ncbi:MAG: pilus assembly PilX N-terminal domain-containing protein [Smithella sp.]|nr:pilus assembly PilX N-terminal domain-containing protein [Smithella sp.]
MHFLHKIKIVGKNSEGGFVLILALIGIMILMAIGYFALTVSTSDMQVASRIIGERKAMSAAEAGVHAVTSNYDSAPTANNTSADNDCDDAGDWVQVDPNDPHAFYCVRGSAEVPGLSQACSGTFSIEGMVSWHCKNYQSIIEGRDTQYDSRVTIAIGVKGKASPDTPGYDYN